MVDVKLGRGALLIGAILGLGYMIIFISIMIDPGAGPKFNMMRTELVELQHKLERKIAAEKIVPKTYTESALVAGNDVRASRPGVIVLGMHRSGMLSLFLSIFEVSDCWLVFFSMLHILTSIVSSFLLVQFRSYLHYLNPRVQED
jgi:hypothetical protein